MKLKLLKVLTEEIEEQGYGRYYTDVVLPSGVKIGDTRGYNFLSGNSINKSDKVITKVLSNSSDIVYSNSGSLDLTKLDGDNFSIPKSNGAYGWRGPISSMIYKNPARYAYTHWHAGRDYSYGRLPVVTLKDGTVERNGDECITIIYEDNSRSKFCHMTDIPKNGVKVSAGQIIGKVGNVGCKAVHLHWEFYPSSGTATKHTIPKTGTKVNLENKKVKYFLDGVRVFYKNKPKPERYNEIYIERYDIDPSGHEKYHVVILKNKASFLSDLAKNKYIITTDETKDEEVKKDKEEIKKDVKELTDKVTNDTEYSIIKSDIHKGKNVHVLFGGSHTSDYSKIKDYVKYLEPYSSISIIVITHCNNTLENVSKYVKDKFDGVVTSIAGFSQGGKETWKHADNSSLTLVGLIDPSTYETDVTFGANTYLVCDPNNWGGYKFVDEVKKRLQWYCTHKDDQKYSGHVECTKGKSHTFSGILTYFYKQYGYKI
jgi:murein DD-endopeptidase MepM/ murein hydrolase activator NlpD